MDRDEHELRRKLAANVRRFRTGSQLTIEAAAERGDFDRRYWQKIEAGETNATLRTLARLARALGVRAPLLLDDS
jgi:transcriptional regulator with XRE-family HTH domain